jgi:predicted nuclease with TOPRIM domain
MEKEEKKKRWRPSMAVYREQQDVIERQCEELRGWRKKYHELLKSKGGTETKALRSHIEGLEQENSTLRRSNTLMEEEMKRLRADVHGLSGRNASLVNELKALKSRGFWKRLFNVED